MKSYIQSETALKIQPNPALACASMITAKTMSSILSLSHSPHFLFLYFFLFRLFYFIPSGPLISDIKKEN